MQGMYSDNMPSIPLCISQHLTQQKQCRQGGLPWGKRFAGLGDGTFANFYGLQAMIAAPEDTLADVQAAQTQEEQSVEALKLMSEEMEQRSTAMAAEHAAMAALQQQHSAMLAQRAACGELEQQETLARMELMEQQAGGAVRLAERQPSMAARLSEAQSAAHANRVQCESLEQALEESKEALASKERDMEALRDAQSDADAGVQQREVVRTEAERRAVIALERLAASSLRPNSTPAAES